jgi:hypothetical protein
VTAGTVRPDAGVSTLSGTLGRVRSSRTSYTETVTLPLLAIGREPLELDRLAAALAAGAGTDAGADGAVVTFLGLVRNHNLGEASAIWSTRRTSRSP